MHNKKVFIIPRCKWHLLEISRPLCVIVIIDGYIPHFLTLRLSSGSQSTSLTAHSTRKVRILMWVVSPSCILLLTYEPTLIWLSIETVTDHVSEIMLYFFLFSGLFTFWSRWPSSSGWCATWRRWREPRGSPSSTWAPGWSATWPAPSSCPTGPRSGQPAPTSGCWPAA